MEADLVCALPVPRARCGRARTCSPSCRPRKKNDIVLREIKLDPRPFNQAVHEATLAISVVRDADQIPSLPPHHRGRARRAGALLALTNAVPALRSSPFARACLCRRWQARSGSRR